MADILKVAKYSTFSTGLISCLAPFSLMPRCTATVVALLLVVALVPVLLPFLLITGYLVDAGAF